MLFRSFRSFRLFLPSDLSTVFGGPDEVSNKIVDVVLCVQQILFILSFNLDSSQSSPGQILGVINIDNILVLLLFSLWSKVIFQFDAFWCETFLLAFFLNFLVHLSKGRPKIAEGASHKHILGELAGLEKLLWFILLGSLDI